MTFFGRQNCVVWEIKILANMYYHINNSNFGHVYTQRYYTAVSRSHSKFVFRLNNDDATTATATATAMTIVIINKSTTL